MKKLSLQKTHPLLAEEWDKEKNLISPNDVTFGSHKKIWWKCEKEHSWLVSVNSRTNNKSRCPYCCGQLVSDDNRLDLKCPQIIPYWDHSKNKMLPSEISFSSHKKIYLNCQLCNKSHYRSPNWLQYHKNQCSKCSNQVNEELLKYSDAKVKCKKSNRKDTTRNYIAYAFKIFKSGARVRNKTWNLTQEQVAKLITSNCRYCLRYFPEKMGIDRVDNSIGYEPNNVAPCCNQCNKAKHVMSVDEFKELIKLIYQNINNF
jgi:hypothetical protein